MALPWTRAPGRSIDIELGGQEVINIELDALDVSADDVVEVLREGQPRVGCWTRLAGEYLQTGNIDAAEKIATAAVETFVQNGSTASLPAVYSLLANIQLARARTAPKFKLESARVDILTSQRTREEHMREATQYLNQCDKVLAEEGGDQATKELLMLTRAIHQLASGSHDDAMRSFDAVLGEKPTNLVALMGKARILYAKRQHAAALKVFQHVLALNPHCKPDPRIGIGLCLWALGHKDRAKAAWQRSLEIDPDEWPAQLLLGIEALNASKDITLPEAERGSALVAGSKLIESAFKANKANAAAANALCDLFLRKGQTKPALKLAERTVQFADTLTLLTDGYVRAGRVCHADGLPVAAAAHYAHAAEGQPRGVLAAIGVAGMQLLNGELPAAVHTLDTLLAPPHAPRSLEATAMLASLRMHPRTGLSSSELAQERIKARELFEGVLKAVDAADAPHANGHANGNAAPPVSRALRDDAEMYVEIARLWRGESLEKTARMLRLAARERTEPRLANDLAVLAHLEGRASDARTMYESALTAASGLGGEEGEGAATTILYNLARAYEDVGEEERAREAYEKLLGRHPEYVDAKVRQAAMLAARNERDRAHELLKEALTAHGASLPLRAFYTHFLISAGMLRPAQIFVHATLKDHDKHDLYALCAAGWLQYNSARENKDPSPRAADDRRASFRRAAEFFLKALVLDNRCAVAAQGLAIVSAEGALGEEGRREEGVREALEIFAKVREAVGDGSVYVNMGHCYFTRDQLDRAIESYETASKRYHGGLNAVVLMCLCRSWYAKATKDQSFAALKTALSYAEKALHVQPHDKATLYNIAMIEQKAAEMLFALKEARRTLAELEHALALAQHAQGLFGALAEDPAPVVPYSRDMADQRRKYGESVLRRGEEHLRSQREYEGKVHARQEEARLRRQEEKEKQAAALREKEEAEAAQAAELRRMREGQRLIAQSITEQMKIESDDEREHRPRRRKDKDAKPKSEPASGDEGGEGAGEGKRKRTRKAKVKAEEGEQEEEALFSGGEEPAKKRPKKRVVRESDDEGEASAHAPTSSGRSKKQFKSKEIVEDSDEEMD
ncbi:hypothetical protein K488DRAFT_70271 [Vararia minispora EC-137]|uniref:Uncharacterized protein n=1 Tax=Vararia minispora EC-137 TaxID=1314806 RepID=A0ACB8QM22_9AGAM|nr:hypothetical protein K488DRAFT_70271 [Vararia minispora EC-137]